MAQQTSEKVIQRYLEDALAAEETFEKQMRSFANEAQEQEVRRLFTEHADETKRQCSLLESRLTAIGGSRSGLKSFMGTLFSASPRVPQMGHPESEKAVQDLMMAYAIEHSEIAMYEALAVAAEEAGDQETVRLAREIQDEERRAAEKIWNQLRPASSTSFEKVTGRQPQQRIAA